ncbi:MAG: hypothetical protein ACREN8_07015, partial [Candidatus Dormibacteraceae bacterium]
MINGCNKLVQLRNWVAAVRLFWQGRNIVHSMARVTISIEDLPIVLKELLSNSRIKHVPKGQIILYEGDMPLEVFVVKNGIVKLH